MSIRDIIELLTQYTIFSADKIIDLHIGNLDWLVDKIEVGNGVLIIYFSNPDMGVVHLDGNGEVEYPEEDCEYQYEERMKFIKYIGFEWEE